MYTKVMIFNNIFWITSDKAKVTPAINGANIMAVDFIVDVTSNKELLVMKNSHYFIFF
jgi:hypothetical protein